MEYFLKNIKKKNLPLYIIVQCFLIIVGHVGMVGMVGIVAKVCTECNKYIFL